MSRRSKKASQCLMNALEGRVLFSSPLNTGYGWEIEYPPQVQLRAEMEPSGILKIAETITDTQYNRPISFRRVPVESGKSNAQFFNLDIRAVNSTGGPSNKMSLQLVDFGDWNAGTDPNHPRWAHFHYLKNVATYDYLSKVTAASTDGGPTQLVTITEGSVPSGATMTIGGGFKVHMGADYPSNGFTLWQALYYDFKADRFEENDFSSQATNLGNVTWRREDNLNLHLKHGSSDVDYYKFTAQISGKLDLEALFSNALGNVDMQLLDSNQQVLATSSGTANNEVIKRDVRAGETYFVKVFAGAGSSSQRDYSLLVNVEPLPPKFEMYDANGTLIPWGSNQVFDLGSVLQGATSQGKNFRIHNAGGEYMYFTVDQIPTGFTVSGLDDISVPPGGDRAFTVKMDSSKPAANYTGSMKLWFLGNPYLLNLKGAVTQPHVPAPEINLYKMSGQQIPFGSAEIFDLGSIISGATTGGSVQFKIRNDGDALLTMSIPNVPAGFRVEGLDSSLQAGKEDVITVKIDSSAAPAARSAKVMITSNDPDESLGFPLNVKGTVVAAPIMHMFEANGTPIAFNSNKVLWDPLESTCRHASLSIL